MTVSRFTDRRRLTEDAYATPEHLQSRISIYNYRKPALDLVDFAADLIEWRGGEQILDVGCGSGQYLSGFASRAPGVNVFGADLSEGMAKAAATAADSNGKTFVADVLALPHPDATFDVALAMHMLYHVPHIPDAAAELRRVVREGGTLLASTNSVEHLRELKQVFQQALGIVLGAEPPPFSIAADRFNLENGEDVLASAFTDVTRKASWGTLYVDTPQPIVDYINSLRLLRDVVANDQVQWQAVLGEVHRLVAAHLQHHETFEVTTRTGVFVCRST